MIKLPDEENNVLRVRDLKEGDIAVIEHREKENIVYLFRKTSESSLDMISLTNKREYWSQADGSCSKVIRVLKSGETLEIE